MVKNQEDGVGTVVLASFSTNGCPKVFAANRGEPLGGPFFIDNFPVLVGKLGRPKIGQECLGCHKDTLVGPSWLVAQQEFKGVAGRPRGLTLDKNQVCLGQEWSPLLEKMTNPVMKVSRVAQGAERIGANLVRMGVACLLEIDTCRPLTF